MCPLPPFLWLGEANIPCDGDAEDDDDEYEDVQSETDDYDDADYRAGRSPKSNVTDTEQVFFGDINGLLSLMEGLKVM